MADQKKYTADQIRKALYISKAIEEHYDLIDKLFGLFSDLNSTLWKDHKKVSQEIWANNNRLIDSGKDIPYIFALIERYVSEVQQLHDEGREKVWSCYRRKEKLKNLLNLDDEALSKSDFRGFKDKFDNYREFTLVDIILGILAK